MDLLQTVRKSGSRGGVNFSWSDVQSSAHRENYLGHSLKAPVGRWQKGKDLGWYAKAEDAELTPEQRAEKEREAKREELRKVKEAEEDAMAKALGLPVPERNNANLEPLGMSKEATKALKEALGGDEEELDGGALRSRNDDTRKRERRRPRNDEHHNDTRRRRAIDMGIARAHGQGQDREIDENGADRGVEIEIEIVIERDGVVRLMMKGQEVGIDIAERGGEGLVDRARRMRTGGAIDVIDEELYVYSDLVVFVEDHPDSIGPLAYRFRRCYQECR